jgi:hypothetical protein
LLEQANYQLRQKSHLQTSEESGELQVGVREVSSVEISRQESVQSDQETNQGLASYGKDYRNETILPVQMMSAHIVQVHSIQATDF